jgi:hypothetical protein
LKPIARHEPRAEASGVGSGIKAEGAGNATKAAEPTATAVEREVTAAIGLPAAGEPQSELVLLALLKQFYSAWIRAESSRGCYSTCPAHDCRCPKDRGISDECKCSRDELTRLEVLIEEASERKVKSDARPNSHMSGRKP